MGEHDKQYPRTVYCYHTEATYGLLINININLHMNVARTGPQHMYCYLYFSSSPFFSPDLVNLISFFKFPSNCCFHSGFLNWVSVFTLLFFTILPFLPPCFSGYYFHSHLIHSFISIFSFSSPKP